jgi:hypothetical protein
MRRAKKRKNSPSARHYDQIRAKTRGGRAVTKISAGKALGSPVLTSEMEKKLIDSVHAEVGSRSITPRGRRATSAALSR